MDFHALSRKELQSLCKKNKIPANITNIAMADALQALEKVEGLDEFTNAEKSDLQQSSPKRAMPGSPEIPQTACRTSTRRKPTNVGTENSQPPLTRTRRTTRKTVAGETDQENISLNLPETPAVPAGRRRAAAASASRKTEAKGMESVEDEKLDGEEKKDNVPETPVAQSSRRWAPAVSTRKKLEAQKEEKSVRRAYSTRQSVRLLEKSLAELSLKEKGRIQPLKIDGLCNESDVDLLSVSEKSFEKSIELQDDSTNDEHQLEDCNAKREVGSKLCDSSEDLSCRNLDHSLESEREIKHELQEGSTNDEQQLEDCDAKQEIDTKLCDNSEGLSYQTVDQSLETEIEINTELQEDSKGNEDNKCSDESNTLLDEESSEKAVLNQESITEKGPNVLITESSGTYCGTDSTEDRQHGDYDPKSNFAIEVESDNAETFQEKTLLLPEDACNEASENRYETQSPRSVRNDFVIEGLSADYDNEALVDVDVMKAEELDITFQKSHTSCDLDETQSLQSVRSAATEDLSADNEALFEVDVMKADELDITFQKNYTSFDLDETHELATDSVMEAGELDVIGHESHRSQDSDELSGSVSQTSPFSTLASEGDAGKMHQHSSPETSVEELAMAENYFPPALDKTPASPKQTSPYQPLVAGGTTVKGKTGLSPSFAADTLQGQFPRPTEKSSAKKLPTIQSMIDASDINKHQANKKVIDEKIPEHLSMSMRQLRKMIDSSDINKENIDNSARKVEPEKDKANKKAIGEKIPEDLSMRQLRKMLKEKLQIANKGNEEANDAKQQVGKTRLPLQTLPENCMPTAESEN